MIVLIVTAYLYACLSGAANIRGKEWVTITRGRGKSDNTETSNMTRLIIMAVLLPEEEKKAEFALH